ncbi:molybdenum cofactor guanylyltransferase MobA [Roseomonas sp. NAR14]|uniref:Molybdenum cofactor guanylyltransferase MobA n=2 Tax=Roseomonas acroporae TaxID=2937791 RepID=A0A9X2BSC4_9PROT|nr:molybdenum cofactor guanylyltransferase MobA [Roseomonas acroporae]
MGGGDKPLLPLAGRPLLDHVLGRLRPQLGALALSANGDPARFAAWGLPVLPDPLPDHPGPLAGVLAALDHAAGLGAGAREAGVAGQAPAWVVSVPGDCPFIPPDLVARLHAARRATGRPLACARSAGRAHPTVGLWPVSCREALRAALLAGERKVGRWAASQGCAEAEWPAEPVDPFLNANTLADLAAAEALLAGGDRPGRILR